MPRKRKVSSYCHHKASGRAVVCYQWPGSLPCPFGSDESHAAYERLIAEWRTTQQTVQRARDEIVATANPSITIAEVILRYREFANSYYVKNGESTPEFLEMGYALRPVRPMFGRTMAREIGPLKLKNVRQATIDDDLCRGVINQRDNRIKSFFKWAVGYHVTCRVFGSDQ